jgi:integrase
MPRAAAVIEYRGKRGLVFRIKYADAAGKQVMETVGAERDGVTRKEAEAELRERLVRVERKGYRRPKPISFREYAERWFREGEKRRQWKPATVRAYKFVRPRLVKTFGSMPLGSIRPRHVVAYVTASELGASTISRDLALLHAIFDSALREELIDSNPALRVERPKQPRRRWRLLEPHEVPAVSKAFTDARARRVFLTLALTGLRRSELQALRWRHVNMLDGTIRVEESKSEEGERLVALPHSLASELADHYRETKFRGDDEFVFANPKLGSKLDDKWYSERFTAALTAAGITDYVRPFHDMRHTALTNLAATGASPIAVMATAGHRSMSTTRRYLHLAGVVFRDDAAALERRLLSTPLSTHLSTPEPISDDPAPLNQASQASAD